MKTNRLKHMMLVLASAGLVLGNASLFAQAPAQGGGAPAAAAPAAGAPAAPAGGARGGGGGGGGGGRGGRGGAAIPNITPEQTAALTEMTTKMAEVNGKVTTAQTELATVTFADKKDDAAIRAKVDALRAAYLEQANLRAQLFSAIQAGPNKLADDQVAAFVTMGGTFTAPAAGGGRGGAGGGGRGAGGGAAAPAGGGAAQPGAGAQGGRGNP